ncbi:hypothetical protein I553_4268 [Mycobacterium xenopi 4042]|uniref:DUF5642 domain-containing protein n=1 Tax=Mycobacterium xenopi 4042 TaxID=1299334 RepID=X8AG64_MYCXE|nr:hypothetical protein I553_4268 [Mycobacterium xenopi 4042]
MTGLAAATTPAAIWGVGPNWAAHPAQCATLADPLRGRGESAQGVSGLVPVESSTRWSRRCQESLRRQTTQQCPNAGSGAWRRARRQLGCDSSTHHTSMASKPWGWQARPPPQSKTAPKSLLTLKHSLLIWVTITCSPSLSPTLARRTRPCRRNSSPTCWSKRWPRYAADRRWLGRFTMVTRAVLALGCVCWLAACASAESADSASADIAKVAQVRSSFGPEFHVTTIAPTGIDPKLLAAQKLPDGLKFEPAECARVATAPPVPPGLQGNMAAVSAEGDGNRFIAIALETSRPVPVNDPEPAVRRWVSLAAQSVASSRWSTLRILRAHRRLACTESCRPSSADKPAPARSTTTPPISATIR